MTEDKINYKGTIPEKKYWNQNIKYNKDFNKEYINDIDIYIKKFGTDINIEEYTKKYCLLDCEICYKIAMKHLTNCIGEINGKKFNLTKCQTAANMSLKCYRQIFEPCDIESSPDNIYKKELTSYKGGRTEVFKKHFRSHFKEHRKLYYYDINSSYPHSMTFLMPYKYIKTNYYKEFNCKIENLVDTNLYLAKSTYSGNERILIPNLLVRDDKKCLKTSLNTDYDYHWGVELKESIILGFKINIKEELVYETKYLFKEYAEYFYNERLKVKEKNPVLSAFYKSLLNSLSGKFGQKIFNRSELIDPDDLPNYLTSDNILINFQIIDDNILIEYKNNECQDKTVGRLVRLIAYITAHARTHLAEAMRSVGHENIYYCDTDSIFTDKKLDDKFIDQSKLGYFKLEVAPLSEADFVAKKTYSFAGYDEDGKLKDRVQKGKGIDSKQLDYEDYH